MRTVIARSGCLIIVIGGLGLTFPFISGRATCYVLRRTCFGDAFQPHETGWMLRPETRGKIMRPSATPHKGYYYIASYHPPSI
ncbi:hypothetical protein QBC46DRAFT_374072 [Diplogelasinospora grovesii]|uniref:Uncharacterized protein n=1 Tax=Diplogelasinospora grovesii TaxID=303347 RepID=A0AAN6NH24_9PEZI|nr:hypothetical protein QBC46DRAFT_374072 [Diplogelasinospora grovesii]